MARPRKHEDDEILDVARAVFLEHGPAASLQLVADQVGLSQPALFKRFGTKEALLLRALTPSTRMPWVERLAAGPDDRPLPEQLLEIGRGAMAFFATSVPCLLTLRASGLDLRELLGADHASGPLRVRRAVEGFFAAARARGLIRHAAPDRVATALIGSLQARALFAHVHGEPLDDAEIEAHTAAVIDLLWTGIAPGQEEMV